MQNLELGNVGIVSTRHPQISENELWEEGEIEPDEDDCRRDPSHGLRIELTGHLRPPVVDTAQITNDRSTDHHIVEVRHHEIGVVQMDVKPKRREEQAGHAPDREETEKGQRVDHRRIEGDRALVDRRQPVESLDR